MLRIKIINNLCYCDFRNTKDGRERTVRPKLI